MPARRFVPLTVIALLACSEVYAPEPDAAPLLVPEGSSFTLERTSLAGYVGEIPYTFFNGTGRRLLVEGCEGLHPATLQRREGTEWVRVFGTGVICIAEPPPFWVRPGETVVGVLGIKAGRFGSNQHPQFDGPDIDGEYRMVLGEGSVTVGGPDGPPLALVHRVSEPFRLSAPAWQKGDGRQARTEWDGSPR